MKNAILTGIVAGAMGFATVASARDSVRVELTVDTLRVDVPADDIVSIEISVTAEDEAERVASEIAAAQEKLAELKDAREGYARRIREMVRRARKLDGGYLGEVFTAARRFMDRMNREIKHLEATIAEMQRTYAQLINSIERTNSERIDSERTDAPRQTSDQPALGQPVR